MLYDVKYLSRTGLTIKLYKNIGMRPNVGESVNVLVKPKGDDICLMTFYVMNVVHCPDEKMFLVQLDTKNINLDIDAHLLWWLQLYNIIKISTSMMLS